MASGGTPEKARVACRRVDLSSFLAQPDDYPTAADSKEDLILKLACTTLFSEKHAHEIYENYKLHLKRDELRGGKEWVIIYSCKHCYTVFMDNSRLTLGPSGLFKVIRNKKGPYMLCQMLTRHLTDRCDPRTKPFQSSSSLHPNLVTENPRGTGEGTPGQHTLGGDQDMRVDTSGIKPLSSLCQCARDDPGRSDNPLEMAEPVQPWWTDSSLEPEITTWVLGDPDATARFWTGDDKSPQEWDFDDDLLGP